MSKTNNFKKYFNHLVEYQNQLLPDNKLSKDYVILYDYIMDLLETDDIFGELLVRNKQQISSINADILLDLTKLFNIHSFIREPLLCLSLHGRDNKHFKDTLHPFCNQNLSIIPRRIKRSIWLALHKGLLKSGSFVRGCQGDIYELSLSSSDQNEIDVRLNAYTDDINLHVNLRILLIYTNRPNYESPLLKPYPKHELKEWLALVPKHYSAMFEVCLPKLEFFFKKYKKLELLDVGFLESIIYSEYMEKMRGAEIQTLRYDYIFKGVLTRINNALKKKRSSCFWNKHLNLIKSFENHRLYHTLRELENVSRKFNHLKNKDSANYEDFFEFFDFKMEPFTYEVDQFGIFKSY